MQEYEFIKSKHDARKYADKRMSYAVGHIAHALNACNDLDVPYRYSKTEVKRLERIVIELIDIVQNGEIELLAGKRAKSDKEFQAFLKVSMTRKL